MNERSESGFHKDSLDDRNKGYLGIEKSTHSHYSKDDIRNHHKSEKDFDDDYIHVIRSSHLQVQSPTYKPPSIEAALRKHENFIHQKSKIVNRHPGNLYQSHRKSEMDNKHPEHFSQSHKKSEMDNKHSEHFSQSHRKSEMDNKYSEHFSQSHRKSEIDNKHSENFSQSHRKSEMDNKHSEHFSQSHKKSEMDNIYPEHFSQSHKNSEMDNKLLGHLNYYSHSKMNSHLQHEEKNNSISIKKNDSELLESSVSDSESKSSLKKKRSHKSSKLMKFSYFLGFLTFIAPTTLLGLVAFGVVSLPGVTSPLVCC